MCGFGASEGLEKSASPLLPDASKASSVAQTSLRTDSPQEQCDGESSREQGPAPGSRLPCTDRANPIHVGKTGIKVTLHAGRENDNNQSLLEALRAGRAGSDPGRRPIEGLANNKLLREAEFTNLVRALRREYTAFSANRH